MKTKKLLSIITILIIVISLPLTTAFAASSKSNSKLIQLRWLSAQIGSSSDAAWFTDMVSKFNKAYKGKIQINVDGVAGEAMDEKLKIDAAADTMPDIYMLYPDASRFSVIADSGRGVNLKPLLNKDPELKARIDKDSAAAYTDSKGNLLGLPYSKAYVGIYYNKALFAQAGISAFPTTWDQFNADCEKLLKINVAPIALMTGENSWTTMLLLSDILGTDADGNSWLKSKPSNAKFTSPAFIKAAAKLQVIMSKYANQDAIGATYAVAANSFLNGKSAMIANGPWMIPDFSNPKNAMPGLAKNVGYAVAPGNGAIQMENMSYAIGSKDPAKKEAAFEVLKFLATNNIYIPYLSSTGGAPTLKVDNSKIKMDKINSTFLTKAQNAKNKYGIFSNCIKPAVADALGQYLPDLASGNLTPQAFAQKLQDISDKN